MNEWMKHTCDGWNKYAIQNDCSVMILLMQTDNSSAKRI